MIQMRAVIIMTIIRMATAGITTREDTGLATRIANAAAARANAAATRENAGIITMRMSAGTGAAIRIDA